MDSCKKEYRDITMERLLSSSPSHCSIWVPSPASLGNESGRLGEIRLTQGTLSIYSLWWISSKQARQNTSVVGSRHLHPHSGTQTAPPPLWAQGHVCDEMPTHLRLCCHYIFPTSLLGNLRPSGNYTYHLYPHILKSKAKVDVSRWL